MQLLLQSSPNYQTFNEICKSSVNCNHCFKNNYVKRPFIDIAQPRYVGKNYWTALNRLLFLSINPGAGRDSPSNQKMLSEIKEYKLGQADLSPLFEQQERHIPNWGRGKFLKYFHEIGCELQNIALLNIAWCATSGDKYPREMLSHCFSIHTQPALKALQPTHIIACGGKAQEYAKKAGLDYIAAPHYAARKSIDYAAIRKSIGQEKATCLRSMIPASYVKTVQSLSKYSDNDIIRLLQPNHIKSGKSAYRFSCYIDGMSVSKYKDAVLRKCGADEVKKCIPDLKWDSERNFICVETR